MNIICNVAVALTRVQSTIGIACLIWCAFTFSCELEDKALYSIRIPLHYPVFFVRCSSVHVEVPGL